MNLKDILNEAKEQAEELMDNGNSHEKAEGYGMQRVLNKIDNYLKQGPAKEPVPANQLNLIDMIAEIKAENYTNDTNQY